MKDDTADLRYRLLRVALYSVTQVLASMGTPPRKVSDFPKRDQGYVLALGRVQAELESLTHNGPAETEGT